MEERGTDAMSRRDGYGGEGYRCDGQERGHRRRGAPGRRLTVKGK